MERREYIVALKDGVDYSQFWQEMETTTNQHPYIPDHVVDIVNERPGSARSCHYALTDQEANTLRNDPRVYAVDIPPDQRDDIQIGNFYNTGTGNFNKTYTSTGNYKNWGLRRCIDYVDPFSGGLTASGDYNYIYDGTGVDVVIQDSGIQTDHPEFTDRYGSNRIQQINWYTASGISGTQSANHYRDYDGHGTHVAGIAAGKTFGWAREARIYSLKVRGLEGSGDLDPISGLGSGIQITDCFDVIKLWHLNKPVDPLTGYKRPTVVNMSWGYSSTYLSINGGNYRGSNWSGNSIQNQYGMIGRQVGGTQYGNIRVGTVDADVEELIAAGVIVCTAAGNNYEKIDVNGGLDYNNYYTKNGVGNIYYHRGMSPYSENAITVGSINSTTPHATEIKSTFSNQGPGVTISAPGSDIVSATSNTNRFGGSVANYYENASFKQLNISGTSMASPQVAGVVALYLQNYPGATPANVKNWLIGTTQEGQYRVYTTGSDDDYTVQESIWGGNQNYLYWPYSTTALAGEPTAPTTKSVSGIRLQGPVQIRFS